MDPVLLWQVSMWCFVGVVAGALIGIMGRKANAKTATLLSGTWIGFLGGLIVVFMGYILLPILFPNPILLSVLTISNYIEYAVCILLYLVCLTITTIVVKNV